MLDTLYKYAKFQYECGNYSGAAEYLYFYRVLVSSKFLFLFYLLLHCLLSSHQFIYIKSRASQGWLVNPVKAVSLLTIFLPPYYNHGQKSWDSFAFLGIFQFTEAQPLPSPHKQCWTRVSRIFFRVLTLYRVGEGRTARKFNFVKDSLFY